MLGTKEHYELMARFEQAYKGHARMDKEPKENWRTGWIYQHGELNQLWIAFQRGYAYGKALHWQDAVDPQTIFQDDPSIPEGMCLCPHCGANRVKQPCQAVDPSRCKFHATAQLSA